MPFQGQHSARLRDPGQYDTCRTATDEFGAGIDAIYCKKASGSMELQAIRFDSGKFTVAEAKVWLAEHDHKPILFEPATGEQAEGAAEFLLVEAAGDIARARVVGLAYGGGKMKVPGWQYPVVVDLAGLEAVAAVPLLTNHENKTRSRIGMVQARKDQNTLTVEGEILPTNSEAKQVLSQAQAGADWQMSIGVEVLDSELVRDTRIVNGQSHTGPFSHVKRAILREISVVPVGADRTTRLQIAATFSLTTTGGQDMEFDKWLEAQGFDAKTLNEQQSKALRAAYDAEVKAVADAENDEETETDTGKETPDAIQATVDTDKVIAAVRADLKAERAREANLRALCGEKHAEILAKALTEDWTPEKAELEVMRADRGHIGIRPAHSESRTPKVLEAALCMGVGIDIEKAYDAPTLEAAYPLRGMGLRDLFLQCCRMEGKGVGPVFDNDTIRAAFSTLTLPGILGAVANKSLLAAFTAVDPVSTRIAKQVDLNNFHVHTRYRMSMGGNMETVGSGGELKHLTLGEDSYTHQLDTRGVLIGLTRQQIVNDDLGAFTEIPALLGRKAALSREKALFTAINATGVGASFFTAANVNYFAGAATNLQISSLTTAVQMFMDQVDADGDPIAVTPTMILVPTALLILAKQLYTDITVNETTTANVPKPNSNPHAGSYKVECSPYLSNANLTGYSTTAWYLLANPNDIPAFEVGYLKGQRTPIIEQGEVDFNLLGIQYRCYWDFGVALADYLGGVKSKGAL